MTVKLAKLFGSSSKSSNNSIDNATDSVAGNSSHQNHGHHFQQQLPPPDANMKLIKYYDHHRDQPTAMTIYGDIYGGCDVELMDDYDDDMSLNSTCMQRNHPYNNSQRPLLGDCRPQFMLVMAGGKSSTQTTTATPMASITLPVSLLPPQHNVTDATATANANAAAYVSHYVQQQKRDSVKGLHGFNDFDALSQQYNQHLQSPHIGYPYGSPPSPTVQSSEFCFDRLQREQCVKAISSTSSTVTMKSNCSSNSAADCSPSRYGNVNYQDVACHLKKSLAQPQSHIVSHPHCLPHASRFEDDFCTRRNVDFESSQVEAVGFAAVSAEASSGPFIFGISHEDQRSDYGLRHCTNNTKYCNTTQSNLNQPVIIATPVKENNAIQQSLSDKRAESGKGGKFFLRKHKARKTAAATAGVANAEANVEHEGYLENQEPPSIKCVLVGDGAVGKTNLILSYLENRFNPHHVPTASDIYNADVSVNDSPVHLTLCDTAGQDTLDPLRELCYPDSNVFLLCFSVVKPESFVAIKSKWAPKFAKTNAALILVGTQADLRTNLNVLNKLQTNGENPISYADAWDLATKIGAKYIETSSATQDKVKDVFDAAIWDGLIPTTLPPTTSFWKKLFCMA